MREIMGAYVWMERKKNRNNKRNVPEIPGTDRLVSAVSLLGLFGAVTLSQQYILTLDEDQVGTWIILSMVLLFAVLFYRVNRQRDMETEIAQLKQEQAEILE